MGLTNTKLLLLSPPLGIAIVAAEPRNSAASGRIMSTRGSTNSESSCGPTLV